MSQELSAQLAKHGFSLYPKSLRTLESGTQIFVANKSGQKAVGICQNADCRLQLTSPILQDGNISLHPLTWENYLKLKAVMPISPSPCDKRASFGTGDRLGLVSAAHLDVMQKYPVFPVIAQQSPRELIKTNRDFQDVLLKAVMGVLESGYTGTFGADADHIKDEEYLMMAAHAGYSMYTLDVSDWLQDPTGKCKNCLTDLSRSIITDFAGMTLPGYTISEDELITSALIYEQPMQQVEHFNELIAGVVPDFDLEVSIDEGSRDTTVEDHLFAAEYLHRSGINFTSLAPKFPGQFQKGVDYEGDVVALEKSLRAHGALCKQIGLRRAQSSRGYRLSLHSGSDKFSVYPLYNEVTDGGWHIKTSGTSWLEAVRVVSKVNLPLFKELYALCLANLDESKKAYHVRITPQDFPAQLPDDVATFFAIPNVRQLFHISYSALLDAKRSEIYETLYAHEPEHYASVSSHIERHLKLLFPG